MSIKSKAAFLLPLVTICLTDGQTAANFVSTIQVSDRKPYRYKNYLVIPGMKIQDHGACIYRRRREYFKHNKNR